jgi:hypothetical protein
MLMSFDVSKILDPQTVLLSHFGRTMRPQDEEAAWGLTPRPQLRNNLQVGSVFVLGVKLQCVRPSVFFFQIDQSTDSQGVWLNSFNFPALIPIVLGLDTKKTYVIPPLVIAFCRVIACKRPQDPPFFIGIPGIFFIASGWRSWSQWSKLAGAHSSDGGRESWTVVPWSWMASHGPVGLYYLDDPDWSTWSIKTWICWCFFYFLHGKSATWGIYREYFVFWVVP